MRYYTDADTLFVRGSFRAASTGVSGGLRSVSTLLNHSVSSGKNHDDPEKELDCVAARAGIARDFFGLFTTVPVQQTCVLQYDFITVFITADINSKKGTGDGTINIIAYSGEGLSDAALLETIIVATEAKADALKHAGYTISGIPADAVIAACEGEEKHRYAGRATETGKRVRDAVLHGIPAAFARTTGTAGSKRPAFYIFSRFKGDHWVEWAPDGCPYYPCHFPGQRCDFCYCPFYPCGNEHLGQWSDSTNGSRVWNCSRCTLLHEPEIADYLNKNPEASQRELERFRNRIKERD